MTRTLRIARVLVGGESDVTEKKMFGGF